MQSSWCLRVWVVPSEDSGFRILHPCAFVGFVSIRGQTRIARIGTNQGRGHASKITAVATIGRSGGFP